MSNENNLQIQAEDSTAGGEQPLTGERWTTARGSWTIFPQLCKGCGLCIERCPTGVIRWADELGAYGTNRVTVDADGCITCKLCAIYCPDAAISVVED
ncbi:4Fe-4S dicluster domain-containing protein [Capillibacterium thermochitinicola]|uniref:4Fe-4S dicluster domain-containing protein n=1 Tax=Capillibacterium thermochitinicola TaxID=2699427 RepID=UPI002F2B2463